MHIPCQQARPGGGAVSLSHDQGQHVDKLTNCPNLAKHLPQMPETKKIETFLHASIREWTPWMTFCNEILAVSVLGWADVLWTRRGDEKWNVREGRRRRATSLQWLIEGYAVLRVRDRPSLIWYLLWKNNNEFNGDDDDECKRRWKQNVFSILIHDESRLSSFNRPSHFITSQASLLPISSIFIVS